MSYSKAKRDVLCPHLREVVKLLDGIEKLEISGGIPCRECYITCRLCNCSVELNCVYKQGVSNFPIAAIWNGGKEHRFDKK
jgi:hypothetical protein